MTLQQLRYLIAIANQGSISAAAHMLFVSQSSLSVAVRDVEREAGITIFERSNRGITLTSDGIEFLGYARQVVEQADLMDKRYSGRNQENNQRLAITSQHYAFVVEAFVELAEEYNGSNYNFSLRETRTSEVIDDVRDFRSDLGVLYLSSFNENVIGHALDEANLSFNLLFRAQPHIFVNKSHPLAERTEVSTDDLTDYPRYAFEQGYNNSFFYAEEPLAELSHSKCISVSDRGTLSNLLMNHNGYTISTGILSSEMDADVVSIPLHTKEIMRIGYIVHNERQLSELAQSYIEKLSLFVEGYEIGQSGL
jgi:DNA-binding transcriptional LysR family regulator